MRTPADYGLEIGRGLGRPPGGISREARQRLVDYLARHVSRHQLSVRMRKHGFDRMQGSGISSGSWRLLHGERQVQEFASPLEMQHHRVARTQLVQRIAEIREARHGRLIDGVNHVAGGKTAVAGVDGAGNG